MLHSRSKQFTIMMILSIVAACAGFAASLIFGTKIIPAATVYDALFDFNTKLTEHQIIHDIRLPRAIVTVITGVFLALSGAVMQAITRNPLAEPSILGVGYGASFALVVTLAFIPGLSLIGSTLASMIGAGLAVMLIFLLASISKGGMAPLKLALSGIAIGMFLSSLTSALALHFDIGKDLSFFYAGSLAGSEWNDVHILMITGAIAFPLVLIITRPLTLLSLGKEVTVGLGINVKVVYTLGVFIVLLLTGSSVAISGSIGFIGLIIPHITRMLVGSDYRFVLPISAILGGLLLLLADIGSRVINPPFETPVGIITAAIGVPFFLYLIRSGRSKLS